MTIRTLTDLGVCSLTIPLFRFVLRLLMTNKARTYNVYLILQSKRSLLPCCLLHVVFFVIKCSKSKVEDWLLLRDIRVVQPRGQPRLVTQLQTVKWADMTAPADTKIMRDMVDRARGILVTRARDTRDTQPILVHCSAGVGRTGTFIAVYKLVEEYYDDE